ncbi:ABC transporter ATP-binding protein [Rhodococcus sp. CH91]|uniref:ABC transporter ATP-binding protein n=1 Tax=Rhodococcus sp. CH91 TaxID=2910256 RepID=UPI001F4AD234|nr:ATP-binding cassette domain-containing protein [Rhodococcus sp. CH91]
MSLCAENITVGYGREADILRGVSLTVGEKQIIGLSGPSGSGKTTFARILTTLDRPRSGTVTVDGHRVTKTRFGAPAAIRGKVAMLFQSPRTATDPRLTLGAVVSQPWEIAGIPHTTGEVAELAATVGLTPDLLSRRPYDVSEGQLQRACLARALAQRPRYLVCDEATSMFDAATTAALIAMIRSHVELHAMGVLFISHDRELLDVCCATVRELSSLSPPGDRRRPPR